MADDAFQPGIAALVVRLTSDTADLLTEVTRRLRMEYGETDGFNAPEAAAGERTRWLALSLAFAPEGLASAALHMRRVEALYRNERPANLVEIEAGYVDPLRVARAVRGDAPQRLYLGQGVWGEVALTRGSGGIFSIQPWTMPAWSEPAPLGLFHALADHLTRIETENLRRPLTGEAPLINA